MSDRRVLCDVYLCPACGGQLGGTAVGSDEHAAMLAYGPQAGLTVARVSQEWGHVPPGLGCACPEGRAAILRLLAIMRQDPTLICEHDRGDGYGYRAGYPEEASHE